MHRAGAGSWGNLGAGAFEMPSPHSPPNIQQSRRVRFRMVVPAFFSRSVKEFGTFVPYVEAFSCVLSSELSIHACGPGIKNELGEVYMLNVALTVIYGDLPVSEQWVSRGRPRESSLTDERRSGMSKFVGDVEERNPNNPSASPTA